MTVYVRFAPKADKRTEGWLSPLCAITRHAPYQTAVTIR